MSKLNFFISVLGKCTVWEMRGTLRKAQLPNITNNTNINFKQKLQSQVPTLYHRYELRKVTALMKPICFKITWMVKRPGQGESQHQRLHKCTNLTRMLTFKNSKCVHEAEKLQEQTEPYILWVCKRNNQVKLMYTDQKNVVALLQAIVTLLRSAPTYSCLTEILSEGTNRWRLSAALVGLQVLLLLQVM